MPGPDRTLAGQLADIAHPQLRAVLGARWGDYGAPPDRAPFIEHAWSPAPTTAVPTTRWAGRRVSPRPCCPRSGRPAVNAAWAPTCSASSSAGGRAVGVEVLQAGTTVTERADHVVSDIGLANTLACLDPSVAAAWREQARTLAPGLVYMALYIGLEGDIAAAGASSANHWIYDSDDIGRAWQQPADEDAPACSSASRR
jgi:all-trans-retinol 13,14-reductase